MNFNDPDVRRADLGLANGLSTFTAGLLTLLAMVIGTPMLVFAIVLLTVGGIRAIFAVVKMYRLEKEQQ